MSGVVGRDWFAPETPQDRAEISAERAALDAEEVTSAGRGQRCTDRLCSYREPHDHGLACGHECTVCQGREAASAGREQTPPAATVGPVATGANALPYTPTMATGANTSGRRQTTMEAWFVGPPEGQPGTCYIVTGEEAPARAEAERIGYRLYRQTVTTVWELMPLTDAASEATP